ncbi:hypothetical protein B0H19DRAFT_377960 [Mycena capillaripes]|nr:hypothetical protein B0H19DRAFT_377960 [Mycena capillaripes]
MELTHLYPAVSLESSHFVASVSCTSNGKSISITFSDNLAFNTAFDDWRTHITGFLLISYVDGCGAGTDSLERSFHLISGIVASEPKLRIVCQAETIPIHEMVHPDQEIRVHAATFKDASAHAQPASPTTATPMEHTSSALAKRRASEISVHVHQHQPRFLFLLGPLAAVLRVAAPYIVDKTSQV